MSDEFDYELTADQWEALKALRAPAANPTRIRRSAVDSLVALGFLAMRGDFTGAHAARTEDPGARVVAIVAGYCCVSATRGFAS